MSEANDGRYAYQLIADSPFSSVKRMIDYYFLERRYSLHTFTQTLSIQGRVCNMEIEIDSIDTLYILIRIPNSSKQEYTELVDDLLHSHYIDNYDDNNQAEWGEEVTVEMKYSNHAFIISHYFKDPADEDKSIDGNSKCVLGFDISLFFNPKQIRSIIEREYNSVSSLMHYMFMCARDCETTFCRQLNK